MNIQANFLMMAVFAGLSACSASLGSSQHASQKHNAVTSKVLLDDDFSSNSIGSIWTAPGEWKQFSVEDGVLKGKQLNPKHGATIRAAIDFSDIVFEFDMKFVGTDRFNFVIDDTRAKHITHAGHVSRVSFTRKGLNVSDDVEGKFNLAYRKLSEAKRAEKIKGTSTNGKFETALNEGQWYHTKITIIGTVMSAYVDGKLIASVDSPGIAYKTKNLFGFTVNNAGMEFDNVQAYLP